MYANCVIRNVSVALDMKCHSSAYLSSLFIKKKKNFKLKCPMIPEDGKKS